MARWEPDARRRLQEAALDLFEEQGYAGASPAAIAERAGLTQRTFYRHFPDKRDVLFGNDEPLQRLITDAWRHSPHEAPLSAASAALTKLAGQLTGNPALQRRRHRLVLATPELRERELHKVETWQEALRSALAQRGTDAETARLAATVAIAVFRVAINAGPKARTWTTSLLPCSGP